MIAWTARVAPLGVASSDHRLLEPDGEWVFYGPGPLVTVGAGRRQVGKVDTLTFADSAIWATGTVDDVGIAERMAARELRPALEFSEAAFDAVDEGTGALAGLRRFRSGTVAALAAVEAPAWDDVWFDVQGHRAAEWSAERPVGERE